MSQTASPPDVQAFDESPPRTQPFTQSWLYQYILKPLASLRLTCVLFVLSMFLVFAGTLAQREAGIWTIVAEYFRSAVVLIPLRVLVPESWYSGGIRFPFPGGWLLGGILLVNLLAAHLIRFKLSWKRSGILLIHAGLIVMMLSELIAGLFQVEGRMIIEEGKSASYVQEDRTVELAIVEPADEKTDEVVVVPGSKLAREGPISHEWLPFDIEVLDYMANSKLVDVKDGSNPATTGMGLKMKAVEHPEVSGTDPEQKIDVPSAYVTLKRKGSTDSLGTYLLSLFLRSQDVELDGKKYAVSLRLKRTYKPYALQLIDFRHDRYLGTNTPKNYSSLVRLTDPERNEDREVLIYMNHPLRHAGETFYQSSFLEGDTGTVLQVVKNPGWLMPYISCAMVSLGMLVHFGMHLNGFLRRRALA